MELIIDVTKLAKKDPLRMCKRDDTSHKKCSRYLGFLTNELSAYFIEEGYKKVSTTGSLTDAMFLFSKDSWHGTAYRKIKNTLSLSEEKPVLASVGIVVEENALAKVEAFLKKIKISRRVISLVH